MITLGRITQQADADGVDADTVERDYVLTHVMVSLSDHPDSEMFQFKGGTLLRLCQAVLLNPVLSIQPEGSLTNQRP